ncbi:unnamed protein product [Penicillium bialowiezense]
MPLLNEPFDLPHLYHDIENPKFALAIGLTVAYFYDAGHEARRPGRPWRLQPQFVDSPPGPTCIIQGTTFVE